MKNRSTTQYGCRARGTLGKINDKLVGKSFPQADDGGASIACLRVDGRRGSGVYSLWGLLATVHLKYYSENSACTRGSKKSGPPPLQGAVFVWGLRRIGKFE